MQYQRVSGMLADQEGTQHSIDPPFTVSNDGKNQSIPLITLDNSYSAWMWVAWGESQMLFCFNQQPF
jgi:hypothetical protein